MSAAVFGSQGYYETLKFPCPQGDGIMELLGITREDKTIMVHCFCRGCRKVYQKAIDEY
jgi:hypothetical protein